MQNSVESVNNQSFRLVQQVPSMSGRQFEPGRYVVNPPSNFYRFSVYDWMHTGNGNISASQNGCGSVKTKKSFSSLMKFVLVAAACCLGYKYRTVLVNMCKSAVSCVKNLTK